MASFRYWRLSVTRSRYAGSVIAGARDIRFANVSFMGADYSAAPRMTGDNTPAPLVATASSLYQGTSYPAWAAFDGVVSDGSRFISGGALLPEQWLQIDFGTAYDLVAVVIAPDSAGNTYAPVDMQVKGSATGAFAGEETNVLTLTNLTDWAPLTNRLFQWGAFVVPQSVLLPGILSAGVARPLEHIPVWVDTLPNMTVADRPLAPGPGRIAGTLKIITVPSSREVRLYDRHTGQLLRRTVSTPDGRYVFDRLALGRPYLVVGLDAVGVPMYNASVADMITLQESDIP